ncbi:phosphohydrolase [Candidatus Woesearchaeota archaeon B3_Woes]|nr:MAG: phosphohydrolase [Candidatus Woesearchaeota archaeon B3_Woes]
MIKPDYAAAEKYVFGRLERELSPDLFFHGLPHTRDDVLPAIERYARLEGVSGEKLILLKTGGLCHDMGFLEQYQNNEPIGVEIARKSLPNFGYSPQDIEVISGIIMATEIMATGILQNPKTKLEEIMCDADLDNLGREDFYIKTELLRLELAKHGIQKTPKEWYEGLIVFLERHHYFTQSARELRQEGKKRHIREIKELLGYK